MMKFELWLAFVLGAVLSWGIYVPVLHEGQTQLAGNPQTRSLRAFLCVGLAYFLTAIVVPLVVIFIRQESLDFTMRGVTFSVLGGVAGAAGALCIVLAIGAGGSPLYIAPLVFAGAPLVNVVFSILWKTRVLPGPLFFIGLAMAAIGAGLVLYSKADLDLKLRKQAQEASHSELSQPAHAGAGGAH
jgi:hypothetical protein